MMKPAPVPQLAQHAQEAHDRAEQVKAEAAAVAAAAAASQPPPAPGEYGA